MKRSAMRNNEKGMTLLETLLVLAITTSVILMAMKMFQSNKTEKDYLILKTNVDLLFQAMKGQYHAECDANFVFTHQTVPYNFPTTTANVTKYIETTWPQYTSVVAAGASNTVYFAQFNYKPGGVKNVYTCSYFGSGVPVCSNPASNTIANSNVRVHQAQIVVKMRDPTKTTYYLGITGATCAINSFPTNAVVNCASSAVASGQPAAYMVWQRLPSFSSPDVTSAHWLSNPVVKEFKLQYTHDPMYEMFNPEDPTITDYMCGG
jgi:type II secretory pathway pseudopilin PulG